MRDHFCKPLGCGFLLVFLLLLPTPASAHTPTLKSSTPADGAVVAGSLGQVSIHFDEELDTKASTLKVVDAGNIVVSIGDGLVDLDDPDHATLIATLPMTLTDGLYTTQWHVRLGDGDSSEGSFTFTVDNTKAPTSTNQATPVVSARAFIESTATPSTVTRAEGGAQPTTHRTENRARSLSLTSWLGLAMVLPVLGLILNWLHRRRG